MFPFFSQIFRIFYYLKCPVSPFPHNNNHREFLYDAFFSSVRTFARIRQHYFSKYGGSDAWAVPTSNFRGTVPPGLRPWEGVRLRWTHVDGVRGSTQEIKSRAQR